VWRAMLRKIIYTCTAARPRDRRRIARARARAHVDSTRRALCSPRFVPRASLRSEAAHFAQMHLSSLAGRRFVPPKESLDSTLNFARIILCFVFLQTIDSSSPSSPRRIEDFSGRSNTDHFRLHLSTNVQKQEKREGRGREAH